MSMSRYLATNTIMMAILHTIQVYGLGFEHESLFVNSFNICENATVVNGTNFIDIENATVINGIGDANGELYYVSENPAFFIGVIWSAVGVALFHLIIEGNFATRDEQTFFGYFILGVEE